MVFLEKNHAHKERFKLLKHKMDNLIDTHNLVIHLYTWRWLIWCFFFEWELLKYRFKIFYVLVTIITPAFVSVVQSRLSRETQGPFLQSIHGVFQNTVPILYDIIKLHKPQNMKYILDKMLEEHGHSVLRLPPAPYHPDLDPIELCWGIIKGE